MTDLRLQLARDLRAITQHHAQLADEAAHRAHVTRSTPGTIPGGDALVMLGPSANPEAWSYRELSAALGRTEPHGLYEDDTDPQPPLLVLATWEDAIRIERDQPTDLTATIERAADYIRNSIDWMLGVDENGDVNFIAIDQLAAEIHTLRRRLEAILKDGDRLEWTRVTCIHSDCEDHPRLHKVYGSRVSWDRYKCPSCGTSYDYDQFIIAKAQNLRAEGTDRFVLATQAIEAAEIPKATMHSWVRRLDIVAACDMTTKRLMVWWPDVRERVELRRTRRDAS